MSNTATIPVNFGSTTALRGRSCTEHPESTMTGLSRSSFYAPEAVMAQRARPFLRLAKNVLSPTTGRSCYRGQFRKEIPGIAKR